MKKLSIILLATLALSTTAVAQMTIEQIAFNNVEIAPLLVIFTFLIVAFIAAYETKNATPTTTGLTIAVFVATVAAIITTVVDVEQYKMLTIMGGICCVIMLVRVIDKFFTKKESFDERKKEQMHTINCIAILATILAILIFLGSIFFMALKKQDKEIERLYKQYGRKIPAKTIIR